MMSLTHYLMVTNYDVIQPIQDDWLRYSRGQYWPGIRNARCSAVERGCEGVYQNGGTQCSMGQSVESDQTCPALLQGDDNAVSPNRGKDII